MADLNIGTSNKEIIAARMFRNGARYWGYNDTDIDNFDPLVRLLIEACAVELYRVGNEINSAEEQMLEKIARLLTPEVHTAPKPAHAVIHARPVEPLSQIYPGIQYFHQKKVASKPNGPLDSNLDVFFSPVGKNNIVDGDIKFLAAGSHLYAVNNLQYKETFIKTIPGKKFPPHSLWLGVELNYQIKNISGLSFFFDLKNHPNKRSLLPLLSYSKWYVNDKKTGISRGMNRKAGLSVSSNTLPGFDEFSINESQENLIDHFYGDNFIHLHEGSNISYTSEKYPVGFELILAPNDLSKLQKELLWINIELLPEFDETVLDDLTASINSFPVANRHLNEIRYRLQDNFNIIPLLSTEQFLSLNVVESNDGDKDSQSNVYSNHPFTTGELTTKGTYSLRRGDVERFDSRNATEYLNYLIELLRDESTAFAALGQDFVASQVNELKQNITLLEQRIKQNISILNQEPAYLLINPRTEGETIFVSYWTSNGELANHIRSGTKVEPYDSSDIHPESLVLMTNTTGGADKLKNTEVLAAYKNALVTKGRIVTLEDVKSYCRFILGDKARNIFIKKGVAVSIHPNEGLIRTVDIIVTPSFGNDDKDEWDGILRELLVGLEQQSAGAMKYRTEIAP